VLDQTNPSSESSPLLNRAEMFGDGFFTTGLIQNRQFKQQNAHLERLNFSAERLGFLDYNSETLQSRLKFLLEEQVDDNERVIRISVTRVQAQRGYSVSDKAQSRCQIILSKRPELPSQPCELFVAKTQVSRNRTIAGIKHLNRLDSVLASMEVSNNQQEAIMLDGESVICGSKTNLFFHLNGQWITPKLDQCGILGVTRQRVLNIFADIGIECSEQMIKSSQLKACKAAFVTNSLIGVWAASSIDGRKLDLSYSNQIQQLINLT